METIVVTQPEYEKAARIFEHTDEFHCVTSPPDEAALADTIRSTGAMFTIVGVERYSGELYEAVPSGGVIARFGVGHDGIDKLRAESRGILCCNTPGVLDESVAEFAVGLMISAAKHIASCSTDTKQGCWAPRVGRDLAGKTLTVIGCGRIGCTVARIAREGLGMEVVGMDVQEPRVADVLDVFTRDFTAAAVRADFLTLHIPDIPATRDFMDQEKLAQMKPSAILINTARGGILDEDALYEAIAQHKLAGAALDVFKTEPYVPQSSGKDLRTLDRLIMTPHISSSTTEASERMAKAALTNIRHAIKGDIQQMNLITK